MRNQIVAVVTLLVIMFIVEPVVLTLAPGVGRFGPLGALSVAAAGLPAEDTGLGDVELVGTAPAVLLLLAWITIAFAADRDPAAAPRPRIAVAGHDSTSAPPGRRSWSGTAATVLAACHDDDNTTKSLAQSSGRR